MPARSRSASSRVGGLRETGKRRAIRLAGKVALADSSFEKFLPAVRLARLEQLVRRIGQNLTAASSLVVTSQRPSPVTATDRVGRPAVEEPFAVKMGSMLISFRFHTRSTPSPSYTARCCPSGESSQAVDALAEYLQPPGRGDLAGAHVRYLDNGLPLRPTGDPPAADPVAAVLNGIIDILNAGSRGDQADRPASC